MKRFKKFLLYFFIFLLACYVIIDSVDYPHQHERKMAAKRNQAEISEVVETKEESSIESQKPKTFSEEVKSFSRSMDDFVSKIRSLKQGLKTAKCGGKALFQLWKVDRRLDDLSDELAHEAFLETGVKFKDVDLIDFDREVLTEEQHIQNRNEHVSERIRRFNENPSQFNTRKALSTCQSYRHENACSQEQIQLLTNNLSDTFDNWITRIAIADEADTQAISELIDMAINSPVDNTISRELINQNFQLANSITNNPGMSVMLTLVRPNSGSGYGELNIFEFCKKNISDERCLLIADKLIFEGSSETSLIYGYFIKEHYLRTNNYDIEQADQLQATRLEIHEQLGKVSSMPLFSEELSEYILDVVLNYDNKTAIEMITSKADEMLAQDPDMCYF